MWGGVGFRGKNVIKIHCMKSLRNKERKEKLKYKYHISSYTSHGDIHKGPVLLTFPFIWDNRPWPKLLLEDIVYLDL